MLFHITPYFNSKVGMTDTTMLILQTNSQKWNLEKSHSNSMVLSNLKVSSLSLGLQVIWLKTCIDIVRYVNGITLVKI